MSTKEAMDLGGSRRRGSAPKAGSVWESRMKLDQFKGGIKVFNATHENPEQITQTNPCTTTLSNPAIPMDRKADDVRPKQSPNGQSGKRKTWKSEGSPVQIARKRSELSKNLDEQCRELSVSSSDGMKKKSPVSIKKNSSEKSEIQLRKLKSDPTEVITESKNEGECVLRKVKSEASKKLDLSSNAELKNPRIKNSDEPNKDLEGSIGGIGKSADVCEDKSITSNVGQIKIPSSDDEFVESEEEEEEEEEADLDDEDEDKGIEVEIKKSVDVREITVQEQKTKKIVIEEKKLLHSNQSLVPISPIVKKQLPPSVNHAKFHQIPTNTNPIPDHFHGVSRTNSKLQSFVDLVMWRDASKSAFVFGIGTFAIISSSYTKDLNISFISVVSYLGLVYLAAIFLFRSLITRGSMDMDDNANQECVVGEEEAFWVVKLLLPYVNEFLLKLRALFSGDPTTTMKLAVLLFILARCGSSITIWKMAKLGFIGVFTVPKVCSTYSSQLTAYGTFWIQRFGDAWESCSHKKAVGFAVFTLVWNLSSVVARIWAVFMLFVAFKYYQQSMMKEECANEEGMQSIGVQIKGNVDLPTTLTQINKQNKVCVNRNDL